MSDQSEMQGLTLFLCFAAGGDDGGEEAVGLLFHAARAEDLG